MTGSGWRSLRGSGAAVVVAIATILTLGASEAHAQSGYHSLFIGHSFFRPFAEAMPFHTAQAGITGHTQSVVFAGGAGGAPLALWNDVAKRDAIQAVLDVGDVELFGMTYHPDHPTTEGYENWFDYALAQNPNTKFALALPWSTNPESTTAATYASTWETAHDTGWHDFVETLRGLYPGVEIFCIPYGRSAGELYLLYDAGSLDDDVDSLVSGTGDAVYSDSFGHADDILEDLGGLVWLNAIYGVDLATYSWNPGYTTDLKSTAQTIMDEHDAQFGGAIAVPAMSPRTVALLATLLVAFGAGGLLLRSRASAAG